MPYVEDQWVKIDFLDKNKKKLSSYSKICFADWKPKLPRGTEFLRYKPKHFHVTDEEGTEYVDFLKGLWHFRRTLWAHRYPTIKEKGVTINARRFNAFEFYTTVVALRYLHELPDCIKDWRYYKKFYDTPLEAFVAAHCVPINFTWNYGHSLLPRLYAGVIEGTKQEHFVKKFPTYDDKYNTLKKFADVYRVKPEPPRKKDAYDYCPKDVSLHSTFVRTEGKKEHIYMGYNAVLRTITLKEFVRISPKKAKEILDAAKTDPSIADSPLPLF